MIGGVRARDRSGRGLQLPGVAPRFPAASRNGAMHVNSADSPAQIEFEAMEGTWRGEERIHPAPWDPTGGAAHAVVMNRVALNGQVLVQDYAQSLGGSVVFTGHGVLRGDAIAQVLVFHWFDSLRSEPAEFRGRFE